MKRYIRCNTQLSEVEQIAITDFGESNPGYGCSFIASDGTFVNIYPKIDTHEDLLEYLTDNYAIDFEYQDEEYFVREYNWIRLRTDPYMLIIELPASMNNSQWYSLQDWLEFVEERYPNGASIYLDAVDSKDCSVEYQFGSEYFAEDIIKICKRYYSSGKFY